MYILTENNIPYNIDSVPDEVEDLKYCVLDYTSSDVTYTHMPLIFLESFNAPSAILQVDDVQIEMPLDWSVICGEPSAGEPEILPLATINQRGFKAFETNPKSSIMPSWPFIDIVNVYTEKKWFVPKLKYGHLLCVPIEDKPKPRCLYFVKEVSKLPEVLDLDKIWI